VLNRGLGINFKVGGVGKLLPEKFFHLGPHFEVLGAISLRGQRYGTIVIRQLNCSVTCKCFVIMNKVIIIIFVYLTG